MQWGLAGREPLEILRLAAGLWYTERRDLITALYTLCRVLSTYMILVLRQTYRCICTCYYDKILSDLCVCGFGRPLCLTKGSKMIFWLTFKSTWKNYLILESGNDSLLSLRYDPFQCVCSVPFLGYVECAFLRTKTVGLSRGNYWLLLRHKLLYTFYICLKYLTFDCILPFLKSISCKNI